MRFNHPMVKVKVNGDGDCITLTSFNHPMVKVKEAPVGVVETWI